MGTPGPAVSVQLRPMTVADLPAAMALEVTLFGDEAWTLEMFRSELSGRPDGRYYLAAVDGDVVVGYAGLLGPPPGRTEPGGQADVLTMAVNPLHWGRGIGTALLQALLAQAGARGCGEVFLEVRVDNLRAQELYRRHGFRQIGLRRGYYQPSGTDAIVMRCPVPVTAPAATPAPRPEDQP